MIDTLELKAIMLKKGYTQEKLAKELGIATKTLWSKFNKGVFYNTEIERMILILEIKEPMKVFFVNM